MADEVGLQQRKPDTHQHEQELFPVDSPPGQGQDNQEYAAGQREDRQQQGYGKKVTHRLKGVPPRSTVISFYYQTVNKFVHAASPVGDKTALAPYASIIIDEPYMLSALLRI